jgi:ABC-type enterobactin transport system permease subunit
MFCGGPPEGSILRNPVGVITAQLGGAFFIVLLKRKRGGLW